MEEEKIEEYTIEKPKTWRGKRNEPVICPFDTNDELLSSMHYLNIKMLSNFLNDKSFIKRSRANRICAKHQRLARKMIIIARHLHLIEYIS